MYGRRRSHGVERGRQKPLRQPVLNVALGPAQETYVIPPPFTFPGVTARIFPIRASANILRAFCKNYLNVAPGIIEFYPALPCVFLAVLDYGREGPELTNLGWVSQHEVFFAVPLGMWRRNRQGRLSFAGWIVSTPFIVVDSPISLTIGRETYGWPKVLGDFQHNAEGWLTDPRLPFRFLTVDVKGISDQAPDVRLLDISQRQGQNPSFVPPSPGLLNPFEWLSRLSRTTWSVGFDLAQWFLGAPLAGFDPQIVGRRSETLADTFRALPGFLRQPGLSAVNLKQFRDARHPTQICYQALVESRLSVARYNSGGPLGLYNMLQGDLSGGFRIRLQENPGFPIVASLGLEVADGEDLGGRSYAVVEPFCPFWMSVDLTYGKGRNLCWRARGGPWHQGARQVSPPPSRKADAPYNTFAGGSQQVWYGPFVVPHAQFDVLPLRANPRILHGFVRTFLRLGDPKPRITPVGDYVYMIVSSNRIYSLALSSEWIDAHQVDFCVPLHLQLPDGKTRLALTMPFSFVDNPTLAATMREVQGVPAMDATLTSPGRFWRSAGPLLTLQTNVFTALDAGLKSQHRTLLEIVSSGAASPAGQPSSAVRDLPSTLTRLSLKQFRDAEDPNRACYQSLVEEPWHFSKVRCTSADARTKIRIYPYPSLPLVKTLGLHSVHRDEQGVLFDELSPENPFRIQANIEISLGQELFATAGCLSRNPAPPHHGRRPGTAPAKRDQGTGLAELYEKRFPDADLEKDGVQPWIRSLFGA